MASGRHMSAADHATINAVGTSEIVGNAAFHMVTQKQGKINLNQHNIAIANARAFTTFAYADNMGMYQTGGAAYTGAGVAGTTGKRYEGHQNSVINTNGGGANFFPGNAAGSVAT